MKVGVIIIPNLKKVEEEGRDSDRRNFHQRSAKLIEEKELERLCKGAYFIQLRYDETDKERLHRFHRLLNELHIEAEYYFAFTVTPKETFHLLNEVTAKKIRKEFVSKS
jgi:hypothetical protein